MIDETGNVYGRLTVLRSTNELKHGRLLWLCCCSCGIEKKVIGRSLRKGHIKSCGCLKREMKRLKYLKGNQPVQQPPI